MLQPKNILFLQCTMRLKPLLRYLKTKKPALPRWKTTSAKSSKLYFKRFTRPKPGPKLPGTPPQQPPQQPPHKVPPSCVPATQEAANPSRNTSRTCTVSTHTHCGECDWRNQDLSGHR